MAGRVGRGRVLRSVGCVIAVSLCASMALAEESPSITWLPSDPGMAWTAISKDGRTAAGSGLAPPTFPRGERSFVWTAESGFAPIPIFEDPVIGRVSVFEVTELSDDGSRASVQFDGLDGESFFFEAGVHDIEANVAVYYGNYEFLTIIAGDGRRAITVGDTGDGPAPSWIVDFETGVIRVPRPASLPPDYWTSKVVELTGISTTGREAVGVAYAGGYGDARAVYWNESDGSSVIPAPDGGELVSLGRFVHVNGPGDAVALAGLDAAGTGAPALYLYSPDQGTSLIDDSMSTLSIQGITDDAQRILGAYDGTEGFWSIDGSFESIPELFARLGIDLGEFADAIDVIDMSSDGRFLLGRSENQSGEGGYWIAELAFVPEPGTALLLGLGLLALGRRPGRGC